MRPGVLERHLDIARHRGRAQSDFRVGKFETAARACQRNVERLTTELIDDRSAGARQDARYFNLRGSLLEVRLEIDGQEQCLAKLRACRREDSEEIAQGFACFARDNFFERNPLSFIRALIDNDLALAVSVRDFAGPFVEARPFQAGERGVVEMAFDDGADEGRLTIAVGARQVELTTTIHSAIAVVIGFALE